MVDAPNQPDADTGAGGSGPERGRRQRLLVAGLVAVVVVLAIVVVVLLVNQDDDSTVTTAANPGPTTSSVPVAPSGPATASSGSGGSGGSGGSAATGSTASTGSGGASATSATTAAPGPSISSFTSSATTIACPSPDVSTTLGPPSITLSWTTERATGVDLSVDGGGVYASYGPSANTTLTVPCDGGTHTYTLTAKATGAQSASQTISVQTRT